MLKEWIGEQIKAIATNEGSPTLRIIANIVGSFLIWACYIILNGFTQWLSGKFPNASGDLEAKIIEKILQWSTISLIAILLGTSVLSVLIQQIRALKDGGNKATATKNDIKESNDS